MNLVEILNIIAVVLALMIAIIGHEIMHGKMAYYYGDDTAKKEGRFNINPINHIDPIGSIILPLLLYFSNAGFMFGWAKPVPIDMRKVVSNGGFFAGFQVSLAGIYYNFTLATLALIILKVIPLNGGAIDYFLAKFLLYTLVYNIVLGVFNLFPMPPLDGSKALIFILYGLGFSKVAVLIERFSQYGIIVLMIIIATPLSSVIFTPINGVIRFFLSL
jgi:Zn-dependent protease